MSVIESRTQRHAPEFAANEAVNRALAAELRALVDEHLQLQEAKRLKVTVVEKDIENTLGDFARSRRTTLDGLQRDLAGYGVGMATLRLQAESSVAWRRLLNGFYGQRVRISPTQVTETLNRLTADAGKPQYWMSLIELRATSDAERDEAQKVAGSIIDALRRGADFARVAAQVSSAPSAAAGGDMGWLTKDQVRPEGLSGIVDVLQPGQLSAPVVVDGSVYIVAMREKRAGIDLTSGLNVTLTQVSAAPNQRAALNRARGQINGCPSVAAAAANLEVLELGEVEEAQLSDEMAPRVKATAVGQASEIFESGGKLRSIVVCERKSAAAEGLPSRQQVEGQLMDQEMSMLSDRYLRNLYRDATVMTPMLNRQQQQQPQPQ